MIKLKVFKLDIKELVFLELYRENSKGCYYYYSYFRPGIIIGKGGQEVENLKQKRKLLVDIQDKYF